LKSARPRKVILAKKGKSGKGGSRKNRVKGRRFTSFPLLKGEDAKEISQNQIGSQRRGVLKREEAFKGSN